MNKRVCTACFGNSYSSYDGQNWICPYCGTDLGQVKNENAFLCLDKENLKSSESERSLESE